MPTPSDPTPVRSALYRILSALDCNRITVGILQRCLPFEFPL